MEPLSLSQNEFIVLRAYYDSKDSDYQNLNQMAETVGVQYAPFKRVVDKLRAKNLLTGQRKIVISPEGVEVYEKAVRFLEERSVAKGPSAAVDVSAAEVASTAPAVHTPKVERRMLSEILASRLNVDPVKLWNVIRTNIISYNPDREPAPSDEEIMHVMSVMNKYELDPFVKQFHAFRHKGRLQTVVGVDGWIAVANRNPLFRGVEYEFPPMDEMVTTKSGKKCWPWVKATCHVEGRIPTVVYAFLDEWYTQTKYGDSAWENYPTHRLKQKAFTMSVREGLGIALYDDADREQFFDMEIRERGRIEYATPPTGQLSEKIKELNSGFVEEEEDEPNFTHDEPLGQREKEEPDLVDSLFDDDEEEVLNEHDI